MLKYKSILTVFILIELIWAIILLTTIYYEFQVFWKHRFVVAFIFHVLTAVSMVGVLKQVKKDPKEAQDIWIRVTFGFFILANFVCINGFLFLRPLEDWFSL